MSSNKKTGACILCGQANWKKQFSLDEHHFYKCKNCRLIQMFPMPKALARGDDYSGYDLGKQQEFARLFLVPQYRRAIQLIKEYKKEGRLLDVGCGTGEFLENAREAGFMPTGIEPSEAACRIAGQKNDVIRGELAGVSLKEGYFDVMTLWSVLEHVPDPLSLLGKIHSSLKADGILALRVPSSSGLLPSLALWLFKISAGKIDYPLRVIYQLEWHYKHVCFYNRKNIALLLNTCGFEILNARAENSFDIKSLDYRMDYLPSGRIGQFAFKTALFLILQFSLLLRRQDELVLVTRKAS